MGGQDSNAIAAAQQIRCLLLDMAINVFIRIFLKMIKEVLWERRIVLVQTDVLRRNTSHFPFVGEITGELFNNRHLAGRLALNVKHPADASADEAYFYAFWGDDFFCRLRTRIFSRVGAIRGRRRRVVHRPFP